MIGCGFRFRRFAFFVVFVVVFIFVFVRNLWDFWMFLFVDFIFCVVDCMVGG